ncbi:unnamed protein product, partial [Choristocarpus tenellus]
MGIIPSHTAWWLPATNPPPQPTVPSTFNAEYLIRG